MTTAQTERTFFAEQRTDAYASFLSAAGDTITAYSGDAKPGPESALARLPVEQRDKLLNAYAEVQLVGTEMAIDAASRYMFEVSTGVPETPLQNLDRLVAMRRAFSEQARADLGAGESR